MAGKGRTYTQEFRDSAIQLALNSEKSVLTDQSRVIYIRGRIPIVVLDTCHIKLDKFLLK